MDKLFRKDAFNYHALGRPGKLEVIPTKPYSTQRDLSLAYTPGVADPCLAIDKNPDDAYKYTMKGNPRCCHFQWNSCIGLRQYRAFSRQTGHGRERIFI